ncbi:unnamed protein product [Hydatigera taeniaeformis]|uniref:Small ribosomal subunit protein mS33 n=1 Tax=Hydatigena taeniaeformis TaxID=6205 RepID=A0A0R3X3Q4_HYDTA|nr:unnamed protein product [Hydatigera taeniaeformis]
MTSKGTMYSKRIALLASRIFGDTSSVYPPPKVVRLMSELPEPIKIRDWYPPLEEYSAILARLRQIGLFRDEHADFRDEMDRLRALRGKKKWVKGKRVDYFSDESQKNV